MPAPSFAELTAALAALRQPQQPENGMNRHIATIIVGAVLAISVWVVSGLNNVQTTLGRVSVTVDATAKLTENMQRDIRIVSDRQADMQAAQAQIAERVEALERVRDGGSR